MLSYTIHNKKLNDKFEGLYQNFKDPLAQKKKGLKQKINTNCQMKKKVKEKKI